MTSSPQTVRYTLSISGLDRSKAPNLPTLEYLLDRFNRLDLEGEFVVSRTCLQGNIQIEFRGTSCGRPLLLFSESFDDLLLTFAPFSGRLSEAVSKFLLRLKDYHAQQAPVDVTAAEVGSLTTVGLPESEAAPFAGASRDQVSRVWPEELVNRCETTSENVSATKSAP